MFKRFVLWKNMGNTKEMVCTPGPSWGNRERRHINLGCQRRGQRSENGIELG